MAGPSRNLNLLARYYNLAQRWNDRTPLADSTPTDDSFPIFTGSRFVAVLNDTVSVKRVLEGDRIMATVRRPHEYLGVNIKFRLDHVTRPGRFSRQDEIMPRATRIHLPDGRVILFTGLIESIETPRRDIQVSREGNLLRQMPKAERPLTWILIGAIVGGLIGLAAHGPQGAIAGALLAAVLVVEFLFLKELDDWELTRGTELTIRVTQR